MTRKTQIKVRRIEQDYGEPFKAVVAGYVRQGQSIRTIADLLGLHPSMIHRNLKRWQLQASGRRPVTTAAARLKISTSVSMAHRRAGHGTVKYHGRTYSIKDLASVSRVNYRALDTRLARGWEIDRALREPKCQ